MDTIMTKLQASFGRKSKPVNAFAANEDSLTSARAEEFCQNLAKQLGNRAKLIKRMWLCSELRHPELRAIASREAAAADLIIISVHHQESLPDEVRNWVDLWLECKGDRAIILLALFDSPHQGDSNSMRAYLTNVAKLGEMEFLVQTEEFPEAN